MDQVTAQLLTQFVQVWFKLNNKTVKNSKIQGYLFASDIKMCTGICLGMYHSYSALKQTHKTLQLATHILCIKVETNTQNITISHAYTVYKS